MYIINYPTKQTKPVYSGRFSISRILTARESEASTNNVESQHKVFNNARSVVKEPELPTVKDDAHFFIFIFFFVESQSNLDVET